jgi:hypothetical protein
MFVMILLPAALSAETDQVFMSQGGKISPATARLRRLSNVELAALRARVANGGGGGGMSTSAPSFSGIVREENGQIIVWFDHVTAGTTFFACNRVMGDGFCTYAYEFLETITFPKGSLIGFGVPRVVNGGDQYIDAYEVRPGYPVAQVTLSVAYYPPSLLVASYEQQTSTPNPPVPPTPGGPKPVPSASQVSLRIVGDYNPMTSPATVFAGYVRMAVQVLSLYGGNPRVTEIALDSDTAKYLYGSYPLTICQGGQCQTVAVRHMFNSSAAGVAGSDEN